MNPMNRRMFRDPMASRQASGILASSPQLANVVQQRQPIRMQAGGSQEIAVLAQAAGQGDMSAVARLQSIASSNTTPAALRSAAAEVLNLPSISRIANQKQNAKDFFSSIRKGPESQVDVGIAGIDNGAPFITAGVNPNALSNILTDATGDRFLSPNAKADMSADATAANTDPDALATAIDQSPAGKKVRSFMDSIGIPRVNMPANEAARQAAAEGSAPGGISTLGGVADFIFGDDKQKTPLQSAASAIRDVAVPLVDVMGSGVPTQLGYGIDYLTTPQATDSALSAAQAAAGEKRKSYPDRQPVVIKPLETTPAEDLSKTSKDFDIISRGTDTGTDTGTGTGTDAPKPTSDGQNQPSALMKKLQKIKDNMAKGTAESSTPKLTPDEAAKPDVVEDMAFEIASRATPDDVDLTKIDEELKAQFNFDPSKASKEKEGAFWNALMQAGLAVAAGESDNALTNVAKGLSLGVGVYGKAVGDLNEQERETLKEMRSARRQLIRDERSANIAEAAAENQYNQYMANANNVKAQNERMYGEAVATREFNQMKFEADTARANNTFEINLINAMSNLEAREAQKLNADATRILAEKTLAATIRKGNPALLNTFRDLNLIDEDNNPTELGLRTVGDKAEMIKQIIAAETTTKSKTGQAYSPERMAQEELKRTEGKYETATEMIGQFPDKFSVNNPPSTEEMRVYLEGAYTTDSAPATTATTASRPDGMELVDPRDGVIYIVDSSAPTGYRKKTAGGFEVKK